MNYSRKFLLAATIVVTTFTAAHAQQDTGRNRTVTVTSVFKPVLRDAAKINFNASPQVADTSRPRLQYNIPNQNLAFAYQPGSLKPLALQVDSGGRWDNNSYVKAGFGSLKTPFLQTGISFGDGKTAGMNVYAKHVASQGKRDFQDYNHTNVELNGFFQTAKSLEWNAKLGMKNDGTYKYGYQPETLSFPTDSIKQRFTDIYGRVSFRNIKPTSFGINYSPEVKIDVFSDNHKNTESNTYVNLPFEKTVGENFAVNLGVTFDLTRYKPDNKTAINNTMWYVSPSVSYKNPSLSIMAGVRPSWDQKTTRIFPNVMIEVGTPDQRFSFIAGWVGYLRKTSYQYLASINPWLNAPSSLQNSSIDERYFGFKGSVGDHFSYSTKAGFNKITNQPLFVNDTASGKSFNVVNEAQMKVVHYGGEIGYTVGEKFSVISSFAVNSYMNLKTYSKAFGLLPLEWNTNLKVQVLKDLYLTSDFYTWSGPKYMKKDSTHGQMNGAFDLNAGLEFRITKSLKLWAQFNNIFNKEYQRWNQYPVYGFNFVGGIIFAFDQKN